MDKKSQTMQDSGNKHLIIDANGITRCWWCNGSQQYMDYHDNEWGKPELDDFLLFEALSLDAFQSGLSWNTILNKRQAFRLAFKNFDFNKVANFSEEDVLILLGNKAIVRHRGKIEAAINNASRAIEIVDEYGNFSDYIWGWKPKDKELDVNQPGQTTEPPSITKTSILLSKDLKSRGWKFVGPTTIYAFMQAIGLVNDHIEGCDSR
jgi:DNA-3-methyladenine glycosylase I